MIWLWIALGCVVFLVAAYFTAWLLGRIGAPPRRATLVWLWPVIWVIFVVAGLTAIGDWFEERGARAKRQADVKKGTQE